MLYDFKPKKPKTFQLFLSPEQIDIVLGWVAKEKEQADLFGQTASPRAGLVENIYKKLINIKHAAKRAADGAAKLARGEFDSKPNKGEQSGTSV